MTEGSRGNVRPSSARTRGGLLACCIATLLASAVSAPMGYAATASEAIASLNNQRTENGIPSGITENPAWCEGCRLHINYRALNGPGSDPHDEDPNLPGY